MRLRHIFRYLLFWGIPIIAVFLLLITGFVYWLIATPTGSRWVMNTVALQFDGEARGVQGSLWHGLSFDHLMLALPNQLNVEVDKANLEVDWPELWQSRQLLVNDLSAQRVAVKMDGEASPDDPDAPPLEMPQLPVSLQVERLALGQLYFSQQGQELPVDLSQLQLHAEAFLDNEGARVDLKSVRVGYEEMWLDADGTAKLQQFAAPWGSELQLAARASTNEAASPLCVDQYLPDHLRAGAKGPLLQDPNALRCTVNINVNWQGSLDQATLTVVGAGQGIDIDAVSQLQLSQSFPVRDTNVKIALPDDSSLDLSLNWVRDAADPTLDRLDGAIKANDFNVGAWLPNVELPAKITLAGDYSAQLSQSTTQLDQAQINLIVAEKSRWNGQVLTGQIKAEVGRLAAAEVPALWQAYTLKQSEIDLQIGQNKLQITGGFGLAADALRLVVNAPAIKQLWPGLDQIGATTLQADLKGSIFKHQLKAQLAHQLRSADQSAMIGNGPAEAKFALNGVLDLNSETPSWRGEIETIAVQHAGLAVAIARAFPVNVRIPAVKQPFDLEVGGFALDAFFDKKPWVTLQHEFTQLSEQGFSTKGHTNAVTISPKRISELMARLGLEKENTQRGGVIDNRDHPIAVADLALKLDWDLALQEALSGQIHLQRLTGDLLIPAEPSFPLGLEQAEVLVTINPTTGGRSAVEANALIQTAKMGYVKAKANSLIHYSKDKGFELRDTDVKEVVLDAHMDDLAWTSLILGDELSLGGELIADMRLRSTPSGDFVTEGLVTGNKLKVTRLDDGIRLLEGELSASLKDNRFTIDKLYFPARLRVEPKEWRTATWISENAEAKDGYLSLAGYWDLAENMGNFDLDLYRYPLLQRADRYAMVSGDLSLKANLPQINITGKIVADAGWFNLDMLGGIPTIDGDVVVIRSTDKPKENSQDEEPAPIDMAMNLNVDLGPRFYLTGYGVNSGLVGQMAINMVDSQITALGALNTRGGAVEMYGQRLQLRRGTITFQGDITNPLLDIQALRTGLSVEAGVKVGGTARKPKISLISVPEVSELEKLSWLLFGHGPDEGGGDLALLVSVGSSFLGDGEPFYQRFGIDELSMRSGDLSGAGSILPATSTASSLENEMSEVERRFIQASKTLSADFSVSLRQALSDTGTVGRASYRLTRRLTAELSLGTVSGLALVYRWFSMD